MPKIFINYRRGGTAGHAGRLFDRMQQDFGSANVFMDVTTIKPGADFAKEIERAVGACDVLLVVIGRDWVSCVDAQSQRRLLLPHDFVRREVAAALVRGVSVVPVVVQRAELPDQDDLPDDLKPLVRRQAFELRDARWDNDVASLSDAIRSITAPKLARTREKNLANGWIDRAGYDARVAGIEAAYHGR